MQCGLLLEKKAFQQWMSCQTLKQCYNRPKQTASTPLIHWTASYKVWSGRNWSISLNTEIFDWIEWQTGCHVINIGSSLPVQNSSVQLWKSNQADPVRGASFYYRFVSNIDQQNQLMIDCMVPFQSRYVWCFPLYFSMLGLQTYSNNGHLTFVAFMC